MKSLLKRKKDEMIVNVRLLYRNALKNIFNVFLFDLAMILSSTGMLFSERHTIRTDHKKVSKLTNLDL